jgi:hypothetical protein
MAGGFEATGPAPDPERGQELADRSGAGRAADFGFAAEADQGLKLRPAGGAAELVERHGRGIVKENAAVRKDSRPPCTQRVFGLT